MAADRVRRGAQWQRRAFGLLQAGRALVRDWPDQGPSSCLIWALQRMERHGGSLILAPSAYGPWLHAQWRAPDGAVWEYNPPTKHAQEMVPELFDGAPQRVSPPYDASTFYTGHHYPGFYP